MLKYVFRVRLKQNRYPVLYNVLGETQQWTPYQDRRTPNNLLAVQFTSAERLLVSCCLCRVRDMHVELLSLSVALTLSSGRLHMYCHQVKSAADKCAHCDWNSIVYDYDRQDCMWVSVGICSTLRTKIGCKYTDGWSCTNGRRGCDGHFVKPYT